MSPRRASGDLPRPEQRRTATTPEGRENQLISLAYDLVEDRIRQGTASAQETTHFLKMGSSRENLEKKRLAGEVELLYAKIETLESQKDIAELYTKAISAMQMYSGNPQELPEADFDA